MTKKKFVSIYSIEIVGTPNQPTLKFKGFSKNNVEYAIEARIDDFDIKHFIEEAKKHFTRVEKEFENRIRQYRETMGYVSSKPVVSYERPS